MIRNSATAVIIATFATAVACLPMSGDADVQHDALRHAEHRRAVSLGVTYFPTFSKPLIPRRRSKAAEYPNDARNLEAANCFDRLAATAKDVPPEMLHAFGELFEEYRDAERHAELLKEVGFQWRPPDALEFVARFISDRTG